MKKVVSLMLTLVMICCCLAPTYVFADDVTGNEVYITVEHVVNDPLIYDGNADVTPNSLFRHILFNFEIGVLGPDQGYVTQQFHLSETKIIVNLTSWNKASNDIRVSLYRSTGELIGADNVDLAYGTPIHGTNTRVTFNNMVAGDYYVVVRNLNQADSGFLLGYVAEK